MTTSDTHIERAAALPCAPVATLRDVDELRLAREWKDYQEATLLGAVLRIRCAYLADLLTPTPSHRGHTINLRKNRSNRGSRGPLPLVSLFSLPWPHRIQRPLGSTSDAQA